MTRNIKFTDRFGKTVQFDKKEPVFKQLPGESWVTAMVRTYYPKDYKRILSERGIKNDPGVRQ